jgi:hypothetical protein
MVPVTHSRGTFHKLKIITRNKMSKVGEKSFKKWGTKEGMV